jgi:hypothetical protein
VKYKIIILWDASMNTSRSTPVSLPNTSLTPQPESPPPSLANTVHLSTSKQAPNQAQEGSMDTTKIGVHLSQFSMPQHPGATALAQPQEERSVVLRFGQGALHGLQNAMVEPVLQVYDLSTAGLSVAYNELIRQPSQPHWLPTMYSGTAQASAEGTSTSRLVMQALPVIGTSLTAGDMLQALRHKNWGQAAELGGELLTGQLLGKIKPKIHQPRPAPAPSASEQTH